MNKLLQRILFVGIFTCWINSIVGQGWPANYEGVMLQGFYWDSYSDTKWTNLEKQADELSQYFDLIWIPNSANSDNGMGYMPVYWFTNYNSRFGSEKELRSMISTFASKGTGIIADVVVNHRNGKGSWWNFPEENYKGKLYDMADGSIVSNDNVWSSNDPGAKSCPASYKGNRDTGDMFDGCRDLDHTNTTVQEHIKAYTEFLLQDLGYAGFRYDMVKGYGPQYTKIYNEYSKPTFSVGEYWDQSYDNVANWINGTGKTSAAFDFPCKYQINNALNGGENLTQLVWNALGTTPQPAGMIHYGYSQYSVTFVDNHDTYRDGSKFTGNVLEANAFILCSPGTPCVFLPHYQQYPKQIQALIKARKEVGVNNCSRVNVLKTASNIYMAEVIGTKGRLIVKIGTEWGSAPDESLGYGDPYTFGDQYCVWIKKEGGEIPEVTPDVPAEDITIYYDNTNTKFNPVYCYSFANNGDNTTYKWPGQKMEWVKDNIYSVSIPAVSNVVFNTGSNSSQTVDVMNVKAGYIYTGLSTKTSNKFNVDSGQKYEEEEDDVVIPNPDEGDEDDVVTPDPDEGDEDDVLKPDPDEGDKDDVVTPDPDEGDEDDVVTPDPDEGEEDDVVTPDPDEGEEDDVVTPDPDEGDEDDVVTPDPDEGDEDDIITPDPDEGNHEDNVTPNPDDEGEEDNVTPNPGDEGDKDNVTPNPDEGEENDNVTPNPDEGDEEDNVSPDPDDGNEEDNPSVPGEDENDGLEEEDPDSGEQEETDQPDAGVDSIEAENSEIKYFTIQGIQVKNPAPGLYIRIIGNKKEKIIIR